MERIEWEELREKIIIHNLTSLEAELITYEIKIQAPIQEQSDWHVEWFLNGPGDSKYVFPRSTKRSFSQTYVRERRTVDGENKSYPKGLGPNWSNNIGMEYRSKWGEIPDQEKREDLAEITGFIIGKHLLNIGYSTFDSIGNQIQQVLAYVHKCRLEKKSGSRSFDSSFCSCLKENRLSWRISKVTSPSSEFSCLVA